MESEGIMTGGYRLPTLTQLSTGKLAPGARGQTCQKDRVQKYHRLPGLVYQKYSCEKMLEGIDSLMIVKNPYRTLSAPATNGRNGSRRSRSGSGSAPERPKMTLASSSGLRVYTSSQSRLYSGVRFPGPQD